MQENKQAAERIVDEVWAAALGKIMKGATASPTRPNLGDEIDMFVPQAATATLMGANPAFAGMMYNSAYEAAKRNGYIVTRRLGMPADFFWKFDYWTQERAFETMQKVLARIFAAIMTRHKEGALALVKVDVENSRFEVAFGNCAECSDLATASPICFYHAGTFAGMFGALLDRDLDAVETECVAQQGKVCRFIVGKRDDRQIKMPLEEQRSKLAVKFDVAKRVQDSLEQRQVRETGNLVDIGYYQLLLASSFITNLTILSQACFNIGGELGQQLAPLLKQRFQGDAAAILAQFYRQLRYMAIAVADRGDRVEVELTELPEAVGPLAAATFLPYLSGELQALLSSLMGKPLKYQSSEQQGQKLLLRFAP